jgi:deoxyribose-phosphate aldolase
MVMTEKWTITGLSPTIDTIGVEERAAKYASRSIKKEAKVEALKMVLSMIDLTTLEGEDTTGKVEQLCYKAMHLHDSYPGLPACASVCVYPSMVRVARKALGNSGVKVASVSTAFPSGQAPLSVKIEDTRFAIDNGADEIDMVISRGLFLMGEYRQVFEEIAQIKEVCGPNVHLKVILEVGELSTYDLIRKASDLAIYAGADFIKTSTGKIGGVATVANTLVMLEAIRDYYYKTGKMIGMKPAGGFTESKSALQHLCMVKETLGNDWLSNKWYRFGASRLANDVLMQLLKEKTGVYQSLDYIASI